MTILHMQTAEVLAMAQQLKLTVENAAVQISELNHSTQHMVWEGASQAEFQLEAARIMAALKEQIQYGETLVIRTEQEVAEWEQSAAALFGNATPTTIVTGGGFTWGTAQNLLALPVLTRFSLMPWFGKLPEWLHDLYRKLFPLEIPTVPIEQDKSSDGTKSELGRLLDDQPTLVIPPPQNNTTQASPHGDYEIYHEIAPKSQGNAYGNAACLPTSVSMVTDYYHDLDPSNRAVSAGEFVDMLDRGDGTKGVGVGLDKLNDDLNEVGYANVHNFQSDMTGLKDELVNGPVVVNVKVDLLSVPERAITEGNAAHHAMVVKGLSTTKVLVNDPWTGVEIEMARDEFERMWKNGENWMQTIRP